MEGVDGEEAAASALIHDLASLLQCDSSTGQALPVLEAISGAIDQLLPRLPPAFLEPVLPPNSLDSHQVMSACTQLNPLSTLHVCSSGWSLTHHSVSTPAYRKHFLQHRALLSVVDHRNAQHT